MCLERHFDRENQSILEAPEQERADRRIALLTRYKAAVHAALRKVRVQENTSTQSVVKRLLAAEIEDIMVPIPDSNGLQCAFSGSSLSHCVLPNQKDGRHGGSIMHRSQAHLGDVSMFQ